MSHSLECKGTAKTFSSTKCEYNSFRKSDLQNHMMKHSEEKPMDDTYLCSIPDHHAIAFGAGKKISFYSMDSSTSKLKLSGKLETIFKIQQLECTDSVLCITGSQQVSLFQMEVNKIKKSIIMRENILL